MVSFFSYFSENIVSYLIILQSYVIFFAYTNISKTFFALTLKFNKKATASNIPVRIAPAGAGRAIQQALVAADISSAQLEQIYFKNFERISHGEVTLDES